jgi:BCL2/adenovirus E1B protein-interacting protein 3
MRMLREAQSETSARTSARVSPITSAFVSQGNTRAPPSPKSPPNSPNIEFSDSEEINSHIYINRAPTPASEEMSAFLWDWSSCPSATTPPKNWALSLPRPKKRQESSKGWGSGTFAGLLFSNLMSLLLGAGLGVWIYRRTTRTIEVVI